jgi:hypothetical protein
MKTIRTLLTSTVAITLAASNLSSIEPRCERIQRIGKFVITRCH